MARTGPRIKTVLLATDFSETSRKALAYAEAIARHYHARLVATHVVPLELFQFLPPAGKRKATREAHLHMAEFLKPVRGLRPEKLIGTGDVAEGVALLARRKKADLLVLGTSGRRGLKRFLLGSVAEELYRAGECPVLTVGPEAGPPPKPWKLRRILYATDFSKESLKAAPVAQQLAQEFRAHLVALHVLNVGSVIGAQEKARARRPSLERLRQVAPAGSTGASEPECLVEFGAPAARIVRTAAAHEADLIVLGTRSPAGWARAATHLPGPTAYQVIARAPCPVVTVRVGRER